jgi:hypothetical protein
MEQMQQPVALFKDQVSPRAEPVIRHGVVLTVFQKQQWSVAWAKL